MNFRPLGNRVLIRRNPPPTKTDSGILLPEVAREAPLCGRVLAAGLIRGKNGEPRAIDVDLGSEVVFSPFAGQEVEIEGETLLVLKEEEVMGVVE